MPIDVISFNGKEYPAFQAEGNAAQWVRPFVQRVCKGKGYDIGFGKPEWCLPGAIPIEQSHYGLKGYHAMKLPKDDVDYIVASHILEHMEDWVATIEYWTTKLRPGGVLFIYTSHGDQEYWRPWNDRKHKQWFEPYMIVECLKHFKYTKVFHSGRDLNYSFSVMGEKSF